MAGTHEQIGLREPADRATEVRAIDAQLIAKIWNCRPSMLRTQQETFAVSPSEGVTTGLRKVAKRVSPIGKLDAGPSGTQESYPGRRSRIFGEKR